MRRDADEVYTDKIQVMNSNLEQLEKIDFGDGRIERVELVRDEVLIIFKNWQEHILRLRFEGVVYFKSFEFGGDDTEVPKSEQDSKRHLS